MKHGKNTLQKKTKKCKICGRPMEIKQSELNADVYHWVCAYNKMEPTRNAVKRYREKT